MSYVYYIYRDIICLYTLDMYSLYRCIIYIHIYVIFIYRYDVNVHNQCLHMSMCTEAGCRGPRGGADHMSQLLLFSAR